MRTQANIPTPIDETSFEKKYFALRKFENRIYSDSEVAHLPRIYKKHPHFQEWLIRKNSSQKLITYLKNKKEKLKILEVGCGNGWLCHHLSAIAGADATGIDINTYELQQAQRVFGKINNIHFYFGSIDEVKKKFDVIIFASSIQYFKSFRQTIEITAGSLAENGEIHILDSPFYKTTELKAARQRSDTYFSSSGFPEMTNAYQHHSFAELSFYDHKFLFDPRKAVFNKNPFPWICIKNTNT